MRELRSVVSLMVPLCESSRPRLLIADDHAIFLEALKSFLEKSYVVIGTVTDGRSLVSEASRLKPDVIIVDVGMPLLNGLDAARRIREHFPSVRLVFLTMQENSNLAAAAIDLGHSAFVLKHSAATELMTAIDQVWRGKTYVSPKLRSEDWVEQRARVKQFSKGLTAKRDRSTSESESKNGRISQTPDHGGVRCEKQRRSCLVCYQEGTYLDRSRYRLCRTKSFIGRARSARTFCRSSNCFRQWLLQRHSDVDDRSLACD